MRCSMLQCAAVRCSALQCVAVCCSALQCVAVCCGVLQCVALCCSVLLCGAVYCRGCSVLQCVAVRCSMLQCVTAYCGILRGELETNRLHTFFATIYLVAALHKFVARSPPNGSIVLRCHYFVFAASPHKKYIVYAAVLQCVAARCGMRQYVAACSSMLQCVAVCCSSAAQKYIVYATAHRERALHLSKNIQMIIFRSVYICVAMLLQCCCSVVAVLLQLMYTDDYLL